MYHQRLSDKAIINGFRRGDASIIREYFYGYCQAGYYIFDQRYQLSEKENLDFMSLALEAAGGSLTKCQSENVAHQRIPICGARCTEMVSSRVRQHYVRRLSAVV